MERCTPPETADNPPCAAPGSASDGETPSGIPVFRTPRCHRSRRYSVRDHSGRSACCDGGASVGPMTDTVRRQTGWHQHTCQPGHLSAPFRSPGSMPLHCEDCSSVLTALEGAAWTLVVERSQSCSWFTKRTEANPDGTPVGMRPTVWRGALAIKPAARSPPGLPWSSLGGRPEMGRARDRCSLPGAVAGAAAAARAVRRTTGGGSRRRTVCSGTSRTGRA